MTLSKTYGLEEILPQINELSTLIGTQRAVILKSCKPYCNKPETHSFPKAICFIDPEPYKNISLLEIIEKGW